MSAKAANYRNPAFTRLSFEHDSFPSQFGRCSTTSLTATNACYSLGGRCETVTMNAKNRDVPTTGPVRRQRAEQCHAKDRCGVIRRRTPLVRHLLCIRQEHLGRERSVSQRARNSGTALCRTAAGDA